MKERTPPTGTVRQAFAKAHPFPYTTDIEERYAEFDRWLERTLQEARAEAWDEGYGFGVNDERTVQALDMGVGPARNNPYRQKEQDR